MSPDEFIPLADCSDCPPGSSREVVVDGRVIAIFNVNGEYRAVLNLCPHAFAPICRGAVRGTTAASQPGEYRWHTYWLSPDMKANCVAICTRASIGTAQRYSSTPRMREEDRYI